MTELDAGGPDRTGRRTNSVGRTNPANGDTRDDPPVSESEESSSSCSEWVEDASLLCWVHTGTGPLEGWLEGWELCQSRPQTSDDAALVSATSAAHAARVVSPRASEPPVPVIAELSAASDEEEEEAHRTEARLTLEDAFRAFQAVHSEGRDEVLYWCTLKQIQLILERIDLKELSDGAAATHRIGIRADVDGRAVTLGLTARRNKLSKFGQLDVGQDLMHLCNMLLSAACCNTKFTSVEIHEGCRFRKHKDQLNDDTRPSLIVAFGTHTSGGGLFVWKDGEDAAPTLYDINGVPLYFDGKNHFHMTQPWEGGRRFSLVFYTPMTCRNEITDSVDEDCGSFAARHCTCPTLCDVRISRRVEVYWQGSDMWFPGYIDDQRTRGGRVEFHISYNDGEKKWHVLQDEPFSGDGTPPAFDETAGDPEPFRFVPTLAVATPSRKRKRCWACENCRKKKGRAHPCLNPPGA